MGNIFEVMPRSEIEDKFSSLATPENISNINAQLADIVYDLNNNKGIDSTGTNDITTTLNSIILSLCKQINGQKKIVFNGLYKITGTILLPSDIILDLKGSTLVGNGYNTNTMFKSGVFDGTTISEYNDPNFIESLERAGVINGLIKDTGKGFDIVMMNRLCRFTNLYFINCEQPINAVRCTYAKFRYLSYRSSDWTTKDASTNPAFNFQTETNLTEISHIYAQSRKVGMQVYDIASGVNIESCSFENCDTGFIELGNNIRNMKLSNCYFENCVTGTQLTQNVEVDNCFFNACTTPISSSGGNKINKNNVFLNCTNKVVNTSSPNGGSDQVELPIKITFAGTSPDLTKDITITEGSYGQVKQRHVQVDSTGKAVFTDSLKDQSNVFAFAGKQGVINGVPFCTITQNGTTSYSLIVDTQITYENFNFLAYHFTNQDNDSLWDMWGTIYGSHVNKLDATGKTVAVSNNNGMVRITLSQFNHPTGFYALNGAVRHM